MYRHLSVVVFPALLLAALPAHAGNLNKKLKGDYAVVTTSICAQSQAGFTPQGQALGPVNPLTRIIETTRTYDGDGNVTAVGRSLQINGTSTTAGSFPMSEAEFTCTGTYQVNEDNTFTDTLTCSGHVLTGFNAGETFTNSASTANGRIRGKKLLFGGTNALAQPLTVTLSGGSVFFRLCGGDGNGVKVQN